MKKIWLVGALSICLLLGISIDQYIRFYDKRLHIVFCDVGQGDAIFVRTPDGKNLLIDGGPDAKVLECLNAHMPFWERRLDLVMLSHPHLDHYAGFVDVLGRYSTLAFISERLSSSTVGYSTLITMVKARNIPILHVYAGDTFRLTGGVTMKILGPSRRYISHTSPDGNIQEAKEFASLISEIRYGNFSVLLTGDSQVGGLRQAIKLLRQNPTIFQSPHHGSKTGIDKQTIQILKPKAIIISVGKNRYGHPSKEVLTLLHKEAIPIFRTDQHGDTEIVSDGKGWIIK